MMKEKEGNQHLIISQAGEDPESNPRREATKLKEMQTHLEIMRNRFKVLEGKDQYHRYKTIDQEKRIQHHNSIHENIQKEREQLKRSMMKINQTEEIKIKNDEIRKQIRDRIKQARNSLMENKTERSQLVNEQYLQNISKIKQFKDNDLQINRNKKLQILKLQQQKRYSLQKHYQNKIKTTILKKQIDTKHLKNQANQINKQLEFMMEIQKKMIDQSNRSLQASQLMKSRYNDVMAIKRLNLSQKLPQLRTKSINQKLTVHSEPISM